jgi:hypothetical protein
VWTSVIHDSFAVIEKGKSKREETAWTEFPWDRKVVETAVGGVTALSVASIPLARNLAAALTLVAALRPSASRTYKLGSLTATRKDLNRFSVSIDSKLVSVFTYNAQFDT